MVLTTYSGDTRAQKRYPGAEGLEGRRVFAGHNYIDPEIAAQIAEHSGEEGLTQRERQILTLVAGGRLNKWIAQELSISEDTVKGHVSNILAKLNANDRTHAVTLAIRRGALHLYARSHDPHRLRRMGSVQFSIARPFTRSNSAVLFVTRVTANARACAAMKRSLAPIITPRRFRSARISA
jgi:DNA-binding CsgD family transcriptional regulator